jgi:hypothetical protein
MSDTATTLPDRLAARTDRAASALPGPVPALAAAPVRLARFVGFWTAVTLPFAYLPLLAGGLPGGGAETFAGLVAVNCVGLVLGRNYGRDPAVDATDDTDADGADVDAGRTGTDADDVVDAGTDRAADAEEPVTPHAGASPAAEGATPAVPGTPTDSGPEPAAPGAAD